MAEPHALCSRLGESQWPPTGQTRTITEFTKHPCSVMTPWRTDVTLLRR
jgi:hypothetical protein